MLHQKVTGINQSDIERLDFASETSDELTASTSKQHLRRQNNLFHDHLKDEAKSSYKSHSANIFNPSGQQVSNSNCHQHQNHYEKQTSGNNNNNSNQRSSQQSNRSSMNSSTQHASQYHQQQQKPSRLSTTTAAPFGRQLHRSSFPDDVTMALNLNHYTTSRSNPQIHRRWVSPSSRDVRNLDYDNSKPKLNNSSCNIQLTTQQERDSDEIVISGGRHKSHSSSTTNNNDNLNVEDCLDKPNVETLGSLERDLPIELSFLMRQHAFCLARMNYLDRQIRELRTEVKQSAPIVLPTNNTPSSIPPFHQSHNGQNMVDNQLSHRLAATTINCNINPAASNNKNGNFIPSDDSGGEYSRATISDEDELSSLLDQIAKSLRPETRGNQTIIGNNHLGINANQMPAQSGHLMAQQQHQLHRMNYGVLNNPNYSHIPQQPHHQQHQQPFAFLTNTSHLNTHQAVPVFVAMSSPIALAHHPSAGINSSILPGVHFQPEFRYNQYYEDSFVQNNHPSSSSSSTMLNNQMNNRQHQSQALGKLQQFDSNISALEQLVSQKEKRQIKSQLKSADNWLKMQTTGLSNTNSGDINNMVVVADSDNDDETAIAAKPATLLSSSSATTATTMKNQNTNE